MKNKIIIFIVTATTLFNIQPTKTESNIEKLVAIVNKLQAIQDFVDKLNETTLELGTKKIGNRESTVSELKQLTQESQKLQKETNSKKKQQLLADVLEQAGNAAQTLSERFIGTVALDGKKLKATNVGILWMTNDLLKILIPANQKIAGKSITDIVNSAQATLYNYTKEASSLKGQLGMLAILLDPGRIARKQNKPEPKEAPIVELSDSQMNELVEDVDDFDDFDDF